MVEAGGVEPPSEDSSLRATTCVSGRLDLVPRDPGRQGSRRTIPVCISPFLPPGGGIRAIPLGRRPSAYTGTRRSDVRGYLGRVSVAIVVGDYWFPLFTRSAGPRHATREHRRPRRNRFAPVIYRIPSSPGRRNTHSSALRTRRNGAGTANRGRGTSPCPGPPVRCRASRPGRRCPPACRTASCRGPDRFPASRADL
jgi:hypothetical protein